MKTNMTHEDKRASDAIAKVSRDNLKSLFHLVCGRPDNALKVFSKPITLRFEDLQELNSMVNEKLRHHQVDAVSTTVDISYEVGLTLQYSSLADLQAHASQSHEKTESILLRWDILLKLPHYQAPQRHTLTVRAATTVKLSQILQYVLSSEASEADKIEPDMAPVLCRVDFIDHLLSQELLDIVTRWYEGRLKSLTFSSFYHKVRKHRANISRVLHWSIPSIVGTLSCVYFYRAGVFFAPDQPVTLEALRFAALWLFASFLGAYALNRFAAMLAHKAERALDKYGSFGVFAFTRGDANKQAELEQENSDTARTFLVSAGTALVINIIAGIIVALLI